jgi:segregation and condensation protein A
VSFQVAEHQTEGYRILTPVYEGPLDLLLELIERAELDITRLALAQVTDQYLAYLRGLQDRHASEVSAFLVIAARLVQIKSAALLPRRTVEPTEGEEEDLGEALARQLLLYKRFKELGGFLGNREAQGLRTYLRLAPTPRLISQPKLDLTGLTLADLLEAAREVFASGMRLPELGQVVTLPRITIRERIHSIVTSLQTLRSSNFRGLLSQRTNRLEIVVTFLAMLELIKRRMIAAQQDSLFGDIQIESTGELEPEEEIKTDFDE